MGFSHGPFQGSADFITGKVTRQLHATPNTGHFSEVHPDGPVQFGVAPLKSAAHQVANHGGQRVERFCLRGHLWIVAGSHEPFPVLLDVKLE